MYSHQTLLDTPVDYGAHKHCPCMIDRCLAFRRECNRRVLFGSCVVRKEILFEASATFSRLCSCLFVCSAVIFRLCVFNVPRPGPNKVMREEILCGFFLFVLVLFFIGSLAWSWLLSSLYYYYIFIQLVALGVSLCSRAFHDYFA